jgi:hypothetical protein
MAGFLYFLPGHKTAKPADITAARLDYAIERKAIQPVVAGPWDGPGVIVADERSVERHALRYRPAVQTWHPCRRAEGEPMVWVGWYTDEPPTAAELVRDPMLPGVDVTLPDGDRYHVPTARRWDEFEGRLLWSCALPQSLARDATGVWVPRGPVAKYARLWDLLAGFVTARELAIAQATDGGTVLFDYPPINDLAIAVLGINYRIGADELEARGLWTQEIRDAVIRAALDDATREAWVKKKMVATVHAGGIFSPGPDRSMPAGQTVTAPPSPICTVTAPGSTDEVLT